MPLYTFFCLNSIFLLASQWDRFCGKIFFLLSAIEGLKIKYYLIGAILEQLVIDIKHQH